MSMKSPFTGKEMKLVKENRLMEFRKEKFNVIFHFYLCEDTNEQFTDYKLDELNIRQLYNQYRDLYNIPFQEEIISIRKKYNLSSAKMSQILGFGANGYRLYEAGEIPSLSNAKLIQMAKDPNDFIKLLNMSDKMETEEKRKINEDLKYLIRMEENLVFEKEYFSYLFGSTFPSLLTGYKKPSFEKISNMVAFFADKLFPFKTKMNKLLFYSDFLMYRESCYSISGLMYQAIQRGPVPINFQSLYDYLENKNLIKINTIDFGEYYGEKISNILEFNPKLFSDKELKILKFVSEKFEEINSTQISTLSHQEKAWIENVDDQGLINYNYSFELITV